MHSFGPSFNALVIGATGGIGHAIYHQLERDQNCANLFRLDRQTVPNFNLLDHESITPAISAALPADIKLQLIIDATGALEISGARPERPLRELNAQNLQNHFALNATAPAMLMQALHPYMDRARRAVYGKLSARVGSISDNGLGGWISYRASKAALNQIIRTVAIEWARKLPEQICIGLHPGTVDTGLSAKYVTQHQKLTPDEAAHKLLEVIDNSTANQSGRLFDYNGLEILP